MEATEGREHAGGPVIAARIGVSRESESVLDVAPRGTVKIGVLLRDDTAWLTQKSLAELFSVDVLAINKHLANIFESGEGLGEGGLLSQAGGAALLARRSPPPLSSALRRLST